MVSLRSIVFIVTIVLCVAILIGCYLTVIFISARFCSPVMVHKFNYPLARRDETIVEEHFGKRVADPYRWLEDPDSDETQKYVEEVNKIAQPFLENCEQWEKINKKLTSLWNYPKYSVPNRHGHYYFTYMNTGLQNQKYDDTLLIEHHFNRQQIFDIPFFFLISLLRQCIVQTKVTRRRTDCFSRSKFVFCRRNNCIARRIIFGWWQHIGVWFEWIWFRLDQNTHSRCWDG